MSNLYSIGIKAAQKAVPSVSGSGGIGPIPSGSVYADYYYEIVTDTLQSAMAIARARLAPGETITTVSHTSDSVVVDPSVIKGDQN